MRCREEKPEGVYNRWLTIFAESQNESFPLASNSFLTPATVSDFALK